MEVEEICLLSEAPVGGDSNPAGKMPPFAPPLAAFSVPLAALLLLVLVYKLIERCVYWRHVQRGSRVGRVAASTLRQLRAALPDAHPRTRHAWCPAGEGDASAPLLCVACVGHIRPLTPTDALQKCAACGVVAHDGCLRHVGDTCCPLSTPGAHPQHFWLVAGTSLEEQLPGDRASAAATRAALCIYCSETVDGELYAAEPTWRCACCACCAHVECFCRAHPDLTTVAAAFAAETEGRRELQAAAKAGDDPTAAAAAAGAAPNGAAMPPHKQDRRVTAGTRQVMALDVCSLGPLG